jgi:hypothetical protein
MEIRLELEDYLRYAVSTPEDITDPIALDVHLYATGDFRHLDQFYGTIALGSSRILVFMTANMQFLSNHMEETLSVPF